MRTSIDYIITVEDKKMPAKGGPKSEVCKGRDGP